jgi:hypothetical protein
VLRPVKELKSAVALVVAVAVGFVGRLGGVALASVVEVPVGKPE